MRILFVCTGNTCRSCMAEAIFNGICEMKNITAYSAGVSVVPSSFTSKNSAVIVKELLNLDISKRNAVQLTKELIGEIDLVLTMTKNHKNIVAYNMPELLESGKLFTLNEYIGIDGDIADPFGGSLEVYKSTYNELETSIKLLLLKLKEDITK